ncbi:MAG: glycosyltransferase [Chloroflexi bacterium]|nr:glycosyltransferase [Chloroflexota bacterium]
MRLLLFNLMTDESDPVLGFAPGWIRELAARCELIDVITMYRGAYQLPSNVRVASAGRERGLSKPRRLLNFYRHLLPLLSSRRYDACFAHMMPLFAGLAGPLLSARGIPTTLWYTHRERSAQLRLGLTMSRRVVSADASSFPYATDKLRVIGHGIDTDFYAPPPSSKPLPPSLWRASQDEGGGIQVPSSDRATQTPFPPGGGRAGDGGDPLVLQVARLAAIKHQATTIQAVAGAEARLALVGGLQPGYPPGYEARLRRLIDQLDLAERCQLLGDLPAVEVRDWYRRATVAVNMSPPGLFDKAALESMACGVPTVLCNPAFAPLLGEHRELLLTEGPEDIDGLRERLRRLRALPAAERAEIGGALRENVLRQHGRPQLIERLLAVLATGELPPPIP